MGPNRTKVEHMTRPDEQITGYGGTPQAGLYEDTGARGDGARQPMPPHEGERRADRRAEEMREDLSHKARQAGDEIKDSGRAQLDRYRGSGADELERVAQSVKAAASDLEADRPELSRYVSGMAETMVRFADDLRGKSADELFHDVNRIARQNPGLFLAGSVALGFGLVRFARATSHRPAYAYDEGLGEGLGERLGEAADTVRAQVRPNVRPAAPTMTDRVSDDDVTPARPMQADRSGGPADTSAMLGAAAKAGPMTGQGVERPLNGTGSAPSGTSRNDRTDGGLV